MITLSAAYYSAATDLLYCIYRSSNGSHSARVLRGGKWIILKEGSRSAIDSGAPVNMDKALKVWLRTHDPAAIKLNYVQGSLPQSERVVTPLRNREVQ